MNYVPVLNHQYRAYSGFSIALQDYTLLNITTFLNTPKVRYLASPTNSTPDLTPPFFFFLKFVDLMAIEDPYSYTDRFAKIPKFVLTACGDEFFLPDDAQFYWDRIAGPLTYYRAIPGASHGLFGSNATESMYTKFAAFTNHFLTTPADLPWFPLSTTSQRKLYFPELNGLVFYHHQENQ